MSLSATITQEKDEENDVQANASVYSLMGLVCERFQFVAQRVLEFRIAKAIA